MKSEIKWVDGIMPRYPHKPEEQITDENTSDIKENDALQKLSLFIWIKDSLKAQQPLGFLQGK